MRRLFRERLLVQVDRSRQIPQPVAEELGATVAKVRAALRCATHLGLVARARLERLARSEQSLHVGEPLARGVEPLESAKSALRVRVEIEELAVRRHRRFAIIEDAFVQVADGLHDVDAPRTVERALLASDIQRAQLRVPLVGFEDALERRLGDRVVGIRVEHATIDLRGLGAHPERALEQGTELEGELAAKPRVARAALEPSETNRHVVDAIGSRAELEERVPQLAAVQIGFEPLCGPLVPTTQQRGAAGHVIAEIRKSREQRPAGGYVARRRELPLE